MSSIFYVTIVGSKQGKVHGDVTMKGREGKIQGLDFSYEAEVLGSAGQAGGQLHRGPVVLTKAWDSATPKLLQAFTENETLTTVLFEFWKPTASGAEVMYQTVELDDAVISRLHWHLAESASAQPLATSAAAHRRTSEHHAGELEDISFSFQTMQVHNITAGTAAADSWALSHV